MSVESFLVLSVLFLFAYPLVMRLALVAARGSREQLLTLSNQIVYDPKVDDRDKAVVLGCLDDSWSPWEAPRMALTWPMFLVRRAFGLVHVDRRDPFDPRMGKFIYHWLISISAANPLFGALLWVEFFLLILVGKIKGTNGDSALTKAEKQIQQVMCA